MLNKISNYRIYLFDQPNGINCPYLNTYKCLTVYWIGPGLDWNFWDKANTLSPNLNLNSNRTRPVCTGLPDNSVY